MFRQIPVLPELISGFDYRYDLREKRGLRTLPQWESKSNPGKEISRSTGWRIVKKVLDKAGIEGSQASAKGLRHGYACAMILGGMDIYTLKTRLGHEWAETTAIYLQVKGQEAHDLQMKYWAEANKKCKNE